MPRRLGLNARLHIVMVHQKGKSKASIHKEVSEK